MELAVRTAFIPGDSPFVVVPHHLSSKRSLDFKVQLNSLVMVASLCVSEYYVVQSLMQGRHSEQC